MLNPFFSFFILLKKQLIIHIGNSATDDGSWPYWWVDEIPSGDATDYNSHRTGFIQKAFYVSAWTYTYYLNGKMDLGQNSGDYFWYANMVAVFYPS